MNESMESGADTGLLNGSNKDLGTRLRDVARRRGAEKNSDLGLLIVALREGAP
jgi:hypothetical protein